MSPAPNKAVALEPDSELTSLHLMMQLLQNVDVGLILIDEQHAVQMWNNFMENHSAIRTSDARGSNLFDLFPELPASWLKKKIDSVFKLNSRAYSTWEQQPRLFNFKSNRPLTGKAEYMYQNVTLIPLTSINKKVSQVCILVYDVTDIATHKLELEAANAALEKLSRTDRLTGLYNRGHWEERLVDEFRRCKRTGRVSSLLMFDIDHFKKINDSSGHQAGDAVIRALAELLLQTQRETDVSGRYGGEEFVTILPDTTISQALVFAERLRLRLAAAVVDCQGQPLQFTVSIGISQYDEMLENHAQWLLQVDKAMYQSKRNGRNQTTCHATE
ncbi:MAG: diguanylate cyclase [Pseudomonadota bacterium]